MAGAWVQTQHTGAIAADSVFSDQSGDPYVALRVRVRSEISLANTLIARGVEALCPVHLERKRLCDRVKLSPAALFPSYIFSRFNSRLRRAIITLPGVQEIVSNGRSPLPVDDRDIELIKRLSLDSLGTKPYPHPFEGQRVKIACGPLAGMEGRLIRVKNQDRVVLSVDLLQRSVITEVAEADVTFVS